MAVRPKKRVSMRAVAKRAQVSLQTVSRVVNKKEGVSLETRERVQTIIDELGYRPNRIASAMRGSSRTIGVIGYGLQYYGPSRTLIGVEREASSNGYSISLQLLQDAEAFDVEDILGHMLDSKVDGIIWAVPQIGDNFATIHHYANQISTPLIYTDIYNTDPKLVVSSNNYVGGCIATEHLIDQGHRFIATISGPQTYVSAQERLRGWRETLSNKDLTSAQDLMVEGDWTVESGARGFRSLINSHPEITAVFAGNDRMALGAMYVAQEMGLAIPNDLAIVGYDDIPEAEFLRPSLTSVHQDTVHLGSVAVREIIRAIEALQIGDIPERKFLQIQPKLVIRASSQLNSRDRA